MLQLVWHTAPHLGVTLLPVIASTHYCAMWEDVGLLADLSMGVSFMCGVGLGFVFSLKFLDTGVFAWSVLFDVFLTLVNNHARTSV
jgi:hypothetical protein